MRITNLRIENFKGLREIEIPLSRFACLIGENNAGKSSVLQAIALFFSGSALSKAHFFDAEKPVRIQMLLAEIGDADTDRLAEEHRDKIKAIIHAGQLTLVRLYGLDGKGSLKYVTQVPRESRFSVDKIAELVKGKKPSKSFSESVIAVFPELTNAVTPAMNQTEMKVKIQEFADSLPADQKTLADADLPTGIDRSVSALLPEPIYIPAVKDLKDDVKTSESTPFGKVLGILLKAIEPFLADEKSLFDALNSKLNRVLRPDGTEDDQRLAPVKTIEETVERFVQDSFRAVKLRISIPPPELKTVLSSATIFANDGVDGPIESKGDGLRRAIVFAILRSYVELSKSGLLLAEQHSPTEPRHLLLFEEPELYLHPKAQQVLFDALGAFSQRHPVIVTTHSPVFFGPQSTTTFVKMRKTSDTALASKPFGAAHPIDLGDTSARDQFQIICYENNNIAFFAETIVMVEGDSDYIVLPHLARVINPLWDCGQLPIRFARIGGKGNIRRYREFFKRFDARVFVITDLDFVLGTEFGQIDPSEALRLKRDRLLSALDAVVDANGGAKEPNAKRIRKAHEQGDLRAIWRNVRELQAQFSRNEISWEIVADKIEEFFAWEKYWARRDILKECPNTDLQTQKRELLADLRAEGVCVWEKGAVDDYYPDEITGDGKPAKAQAFCNAVTGKERALQLCSSDFSVTGGKPVSEFETVFESIFTC